MYDLLNKLKAEDSKHLRISKNFHILFWIMIILYTAIFILNPDKELLLNHRLGGACFVSAFISFAIYFRKYYKELKSVDYSLPTTEMLKKAIERYKLFQKKQLLILLPLIFLDIGITFSFINRFDDFNNLQTIFFIQSIYIPLMLLSILIGILIWYKQQKPLRDKAIDLLNEIEV